MSRSLKKGPFIDVHLLDKVLKYHVVPGRVLKAEVLLNHATLKHSYAGYAAPQG